jgi:hypothetical protein
VIVKSESFIIGALIIRPSILDEVPELAINFFSSERNKKVFRAIVDLRALEASLERQAAGKGKR